MPRSVQEIKAWKATDGRIFLTETEAAQHQRALDLKARVSDVVDMFFFNNMSQEQLVDALISYTDALVSAMEV